jgi:nuclear pore complex protein Nup85
MDHLECFLERVGIDSERKALKLLRLCAIHRLDRLERTVCRVMGRRAVATGQTGSALVWYTRAGDEASVDAVTQLANHVLEDYQRDRLRGE